MDITSRGRPVVLVALLASLVLALLPPVSASAEADNPTVGDPTVASAVAPGRLLVGIADGANASGLSRSIEARGGEVVDQFDRLGVLVVTVPESAQADLAAALENNPSVEYVEPDLLVRQAGEVEPNDPLWGEQWGLKRTEFPAAWARHVGSKGAVIAVLDTGVSPDHPDLKANLVPGWNILDDDADTRDLNGHGTLSAGVAAAVGDNGIGITGACWRCGIMPVTVMDEKGGGFLSNLIPGIEWAAENGADVISMSLGTDGYVDPDSKVLELLQEAVDEARDEGVVLVAAAGNQASSTLSYPAASHGVIGVAASDSTDGRCSFSNHGSWVDLAAPGCDNHATTVSGGYTALYRGTSAAAPLVAGAAGLLRSVARDASNDEVEAALMSTARSRTYVAHGRLDAGAAMAALSTSTKQLHSVERHAGAGRIETAIAVSKASYSTAETVVLAYSHGFPDALAGAPLARKLGGPILLTRGGASLESDVMEEIRRLEALKVVILGGVGAVSQEVENDLKEARLSVTRHAGRNRHETAGKVAGEVLKGQSGTKRAYLVNGDDGWPDAVAVSGLAAAEGRPILLATRNGLPKATEDALRDLGVTEVTIVGGTGVVANTVARAIQDLGIALWSPISGTTRIAGSNRYETSSIVAETTASAGFSPARVWVATGQDFPDALSAGPAVATSGGVLLLVHGTDTNKGSESHGWLKEHATSIEQLDLVGGTGVISETVRRHLEKLVNGS